MAKVIFGVWDDMVIDNRGKKVFEIDPDFPEDGWEQHKIDLKRIPGCRHRGRPQRRFGQGNFRFQFGNSHDSL